MVDGNGTRVIDQSDNCKGFAGDMKIVPVPCLEDNYSYLYGFNFSGHKLKTGELGLVFVAKCGID